MIGCFIACHFYLILIICKNGFINCHSAQLADAVEYANCISDEG